MFFLLEPFQLHGIPYIFNSQKQCLALKRHSVLTITWGLCGLAETRQTHKTLIVLKILASLRKFQPLFWSIL